MCGLKSFPKGLASLSERFLRDASHFLPATSCEPKSTTLTFAEPIIIRSVTQCRRALHSFNLSSNEILILMIEWNTARRIVDFFFTFIE